MKIPFNAKKRQYQVHKEAIDALLLEGITQTDPTAITTLEKALSDYLGVEDMIVCNTQFNAFVLLFMILELKAGDEIITSPLGSGIAVQAALFMGAKVIFVDVNAQDYTLDIEQVEDAITERTKLIIPVSTFGNCADMTAINALALHHDLCVIEDAAESFGSLQKEKRSLHLSKLSTTSFHPDMPLSGFGNGGALYIEDADLRNKARVLRSQGREAQHYTQIGIEACMDQLQAKTLTYRLDFVNQEIQERQEHFILLQKLLEGTSLTRLPFSKESNAAYFPIFCEDREGIEKRLSSQGINSKVPFSAPLHLHTAFSFMQYQKGDFPISESLTNNLLLLPFYAQLTTQECHFMATVLTEKES